MQLTIESFSDYKKTDRGPSAKIKATNGDLIYINEEPGPLIGKTVDIDVNEKTSQKGNRYKVGKILKIYQASEAASSNGKITWDAYRAMAEAAHGVALLLEPDLPSENGEPHIDRSSARAAIVNTTMINYCQGRIVVPEEDEDTPF
jgi:hypothetical protein